MEESEISVKKSVHNQLQKSAIKYINAVKADAK